MSVAATGGDEITIVGQYKGEGRFFNCNHDLLSFSHALKGRKKVGYLVHSLKVAIFYIISSFSLVYLSFYHQTCLNYLSPLLWRDYFLAIENPIELYKYSNKIFV
jgi:hypothetical protein